MAAEHVDVVEPGRREPDHILIAHVEALGLELVQRRVHADRVPRHDDIHHQAQGAELVFLALAAALAQFAPLALEHDAGKLMTALSVVDLDQNAPAMRLVVNEAEQVEGGSLHSGASATAEIGG